MPIDMEEIFFSGSDCQAEFRQMQSCFSKYPKLYLNNRTTENDVELPNNEMNHPEARRHRINEAKKMKNN